MNEKQDATFKTDSGRTVRVSRLTFRWTYANCLEGTSETNSFYMREDGGLAERTREQFPRLQAIYVFDDGAPELPRFGWMAFLESEAIRSKDPDYRSRLGICWYTDMFVDDLPSLLENLIGQINWEERAEEYGDAW